MDLNLSVQVLLNVKYGENKRQSLDIYMPSQNRLNPIIFFVHGGAWSSGDRQEYESLGYFYAKNGFTTIIIDHQLYPSVTHPTHIQDVATAFAWIKNNIQNFKGDKDRICICGHSSGAHLVSLLVSNQRYLNEMNCDISDVKGVIAISGIYSLGYNLTIAGLGGIFPKSKDRYEASPINFLNKEMPPFLILYAENEIITLGSQSISFHRALKNNKIPAKLKYVKKHDHYSIITYCAKPGFGSKMILDFTEEIFNAV